MQKKINSALSFVLVDSVCGIDLLGTDIGAMADGGAAPDTIIRISDFHALRLRAVSRIAVVPLQERHRARADEVWILTELRAGGITQHAIDAVAERLVLCEL